MTKTKPKTKTTDPQTWAGFADVVRLALEPEPRFAEDWEELAAEGADDSTILKFACHCLAQHGVSYVDESPQAVVWTREGGVPTLRVWFVDREGVEMDAPRTPGRKPDFDALGFVEVVRQVYGIGRQRDEKGRKGTDAEVAKKAEVTTGLSPGVEVNEHGVVTAGLETLEVTCWPKARKVEASIRICETHPGEWRFATTFDCRWPGAVGGVSAAIKAEGPSRPSRDACIADACTVIAVRLVQRKRDTSGKVKALAEKAIEEFDQWRPDKKAEGKEPKAKNKGPSTKDKEPMKKSSAWTAAELETLANTPSDAVVAEKLGRSMNAVRKKRAKLGPQPTKSAAKTVKEPSPEGAKAQGGKGAKGKSQSAKPKAPSPDLVELVKKSSPKVQADVVRALMKADVVWRGAKPGVRCRIVDVELPGLPVLTTGEQAVEGAWEPNALGEETVVWSDAWAPPRNIAALVFGKQAKESPPESTG